MQNVFVFVLISNLECEHSYVFIFYDAGEAESARGDVFPEL